MTRESSTNPLVLTSVGTKMVVAITGIALILFVTAHMLGNLQIFAGADALNSYAVKLKSLGPLLWVARIGLLAVFVLHIVLTVKLSRANYAARGAAASVSPVASLVGERYSHPYKYSTATASSRFMILTGLLILLFVVYHLAHFTFHLFGEPPKLTAGKELDVFNMVVQGFRNPWINVTYISFQLVLGLHIYHGASSALQTLGLRIQISKNPINLCGIAIAGLITAGNISIPVAVWLHLL